MLFQESCKEDEALEPLLDAVRVLITILSKTETDTDKEPGMTMQTSNTIKIQTAEEGTKRFNDNGYWCRDLFVTGLTPLKYWNTSSSVLKGLCHGICDLFKKLNLVFASFVATEVKNKGEKLALGSFSKDFFERCT